MTGDGGRIRYGITLPIFDCAAPDAVGMALEAEDMGVDAVFAFDHLSPPGRRGSVPTLECFSLLGAVAAATSSVEIGTLVAKVWLRPPEVTAQAFATLQEISDGRVIAGLGISDRLSAGEVETYSLAYPQRAARIVALERTVERLHKRGVSRIWIGGSSPSLLEVAAGSAESVNVWNATPDRVSEVSAALAAGRVPGREAPPGVTWGGDPATLEGRAESLREIRARGAQYVIVSVPKPGDVARVVRLLKEVEAG